MDSKIREILFSPLSAGTLSAIVPDFCIEHPTGKINVPALLTRDGSNFKFTLHFMQPVPPAELGTLRNQVVTQKDQLTVSGQINGEIAFRCSDVFPPAGNTTRSRGTSTIGVSSYRMELVAEGTDTLNTSEVRNLLGEQVEAPTGDCLPFNVHIIFHGPKLRIRDSGTETTRKKDFLGELPSSVADTHLFSGEGYEGALIQQKEELHLYLKSKDNESIRSGEIEDLANRVSRSVGFAFGFHPWPTYREIRLDHRVKERWLSPRLGLKQTFLSPISESLWSHYHSDRGNLLYSIIPTITAGLGQLEAGERKRIETLLWHVHSSDLSKLPDSTRVLILCAALDGLMQVIAGVASKKKRPPTDKVWQKANEHLGLSWDRWTNKIFELRKKHRDDLSHGRLWVAEEEDFSDNYKDYAELGCAFMVFIAARCGYEGPLIADPYKPRQVIISSIKETVPSP